MISRCCNLLVIPFFSIVLGYATSSLAENLGDVQNKLEQAVAEGDVDTVNHFIAKGANVNRGTKVIPGLGGIGPTSPLLHVVIQEGHIAVVELLIAKGAKLNARDSRARTPLHWAAYEGHAAIADRLIAKGAKVNAKDLRNRTP